jgi:hypothetical protein
MNWKLIFTLSLFGVGMGIASLFGVTRRIEPFLWLVILLFYAWWIAKHCASKFFLHGFLVSFLNGVWISLVHAAFFAKYISSNPEVLAGFQNFPPGISRRVVMLIAGPIAGTLAGIAGGLLAWLASKLARKSPDPKTSE